MTVPSPYRTAWPVGAEKPPEALRAVLDDIEARLDGAGNDGASDFGLPQDGTDIAPTLNGLMEQRQAAGILITRYRPRTGEALPYINSFVKVPSGHTLDRSMARFRRGPRGRMGMSGKLAELPETGQYRLAAPIAAGATTIYLRVPLGGSLTALTNGAAAEMPLILRGENDAAGEVLQEQRETIPFTVVNSSDDQNIQILLGRPTEYAYAIEYPGSAWPGELGTGDFTLVTVAVGSKLTANAVKGDHKVTVAAIPSGMIKGSAVFLKSDELVPSGTSVLPYGEEPHTVRRIEGLDVYLERPVSRRFPTAQASRLLLVDATVGAKLLCGHQPDELTAAAAAAPASRTDWYNLHYAWWSEIIEPWVDDQHTTHWFRGAAIMDRRGYGNRIVRPRIFRRGGEGPGDCNGDAKFYQNLGRTEGLFATGGRHLMIAQGGSAPAWQDGHVVGGNTNGADTHGCATIGAVFDGLYIVASDATSSDSTQQIGATIGNTSHRAPDEDTTLRNCTFAGFNAGTNAGIAIRIPAANTLIENCRFLDCATGIRVVRDSRAGVLVSTGITVRDCDLGGSAKPFEVNGFHATWDVGATYAGTTTRPVSVMASNGREYSTVIEKTGGSEPSHTSGTVDGWTHVGLAIRALGDLRLLGNLTGAGTSSINEASIDGLVNLTWGSAGSGTDITDGSILDGNGGDGATIFDGNGP